MPLTPQDVRNKRFTPVRLREGYDMAEVDAFLDEVETELVRLTAEGDDLHQQAKGGSPFAAASLPEPAASPVEQQTAQPQAAAPPAPASAPATDGAPVASRAARLLEIAARNADELVAEAQAEAEQLLSAARAQAQKLTQTAQAAADELGATTERRRTELLGDLDRQKTGLGEQIDHLRTFEREYRNRLREYLTSHLATLDGEEADVVSMPPGPAERNGRPQG